MRDRDKLTTPVAAPMGRWRALAARCLDPGGTTLSSRLRNALFVLFLGGILAYGAGFAWYILARLDLINLIRGLSSDDAFYYFQIAHNLAEGKFSTFDGGITRTNGYHPLWLFLITPFYWVFDKEAALFSYGYLHAQKEGTEAAFYRRYGITWFANTWFPQEETEAQVPPVVRDYLDRKSRERPSDSEIVFEGSPYLFYRSNVPHKRQFRLLTTEPPGMSSGGIHRSDWFWQRLEPHFDHRSDGVGLIVDGRAAQAFVRNCAPDELAAWSRVGPGEETAVDSWTRTQTGLCVNSRVLPHNALPSVRVATMSVSDWVSGPLGSGRPIIRSDWDVYLVEDSLIYAKDQCSPEDTEPLFFVHLDPVDRNDLPGDRRQYGFDGFNFEFRNHLLIEGGVCVARRELPVRDYAIASIRTGQFIGDGNDVWEGSFDIVEPADDGNTAR